MTILERVERDIPAAMKAKETLQLETLRSIKTAIIFKIAKTTEAEIAVLKSMVKQRHESAVLFRQAGREEQAFKEDVESGIIKLYMPEEASQAEIELAVNEALVELLAEGPVTIKRMGDAMKLTSAKLGGKRADGKIVSDLVRSRIA